MCTNTSLRLRSVHTVLLFFQMDEGIFPELGDYIPSANLKPGGSDQSKKKTSSYFGTVEEEKAPSHHDIKAEKKKQAVPAPAPKPESTTKAAGLLSRYAHSYLTVLPID